MYLIEMNSRTSERRKLRHSERLQFKKDNELYNEARLDNETVEGQSKINLSEQEENKKRSFFSIIYSAIFRRN